MNYYKIKQEESKEMKKIFCLISALPIIYGCSSTETNPTLEDRYSEAQTALTKGHWGEAYYKFESFEKDFPTSDWSANALMNGAYSAYKDKDYLNAMMMSERFLRFHPGNPNADYVLYLKGMIAFDQLSDMHREQSMAEQALSTFNELVEKYPNSRYTKNVKNKIGILKNQIAGKELNLARRQMKIENYTASITILQGLITNYSETIITPEALFRLYESYTALNLPDKATEAKILLKNNYPENDWTKKLK